YVQLLTTVNLPIIGAVVSRRVIRQGIIRQKGDGFSRHCGKIKRFSSIGNKGACGSRTAFRNGLSAQPAELGGGTANERRAYTRSSGLYAHRIAHCYCDHSDSRCYPLPCLRKGARESQADLLPLQRETAWPGGP